MSCGAPAGGVSLVDVGNEAVIGGVVRRSGVPERGAYVRLLDSSGEFAAEVPTDEEGSFRFFAAPGTWTVRALAAGGVSASGAAEAERGAIAPVELELA